MKKIPNGIEVRNLVGKKFENVEADRKAENDRMRQDCEFVRKMDDVEALEQAKRSDRRVKIEAGRKTGSESERDNLERIHRWLLSLAKRMRSIVRYGKELMLLQDAAIAVHRLHRNLASG